MLELILNTQIIVVYHVCVDRWTICNSYTCCMQQTHSCQVWVKHKKRNEFIVHVADVDSQLPHDHSCANFRYWQDDQHSRCYDFHLLIGGTKLQPCTCSLSGIQQNYYLSTLHATVRIFCTQGMVDLSCLNPLNITSCAKHAACCMKICSIIL